MHAQTTVVVALLAALVSSQVNAQVPDAIRKLREPLTKISLREMFTNMENPNTVTFYTKCVIGEATCDRVGHALKHILTDHIPGQNLCHGCTDCERERLDYVIDIVKEKYPKHACAVQNSLKKNLFGTSVCA
ncbi:uncharacterized protein LOC135219658 [Macrobrachium nipponense]|uniref:uncharacterized protein LOC135219658 n=1 Tax=Macrobrachium nipponense TaxID=159736 RepID=UPI0030C80F7F